MELVEEFKAIGAALTILRRARIELMEGPDAVWNVVAHASKYLERQAAELLKQLQPSPGTETELIGVIEAPTQPMDPPRVPAP
jgi:hypothetical protein